MNNLLEELDKRTEERRRRNQKGCTSAMKRREGGAYAREESEDWKEFASMDFEEPYSSSLKSPRVLNITQTCKFNIL